MNIQQIDYIKTLNTKYPSGTLQYILLQNNLQSATFEGTLKWLLERYVEHVEEYKAENARMALALKKNNLYTSENVLGE
jgi:hypothetical protein